ncbi:MAG TPA: rhomboid family intramembrane serine protease [Porphyromonadaceae bacterium]|nr:rhomboid family intramembrane serine protease [Porphyromonadaceae bacterium]
MNIPPVTKNLLIINALFCLASLVLPPVMGRFFGNPFELSRFLGLHFFLAKDFNILQPITYMFLHSTHSFSHILCNMFSLFMFGPVLERYFGGKRFLIFYIVCGLGAAVIQELMWFIDFYPLIFHKIVPIDSFGNVYENSFLYNTAITIGASGCVFGILLGFGMLFPDDVIFLMIPPMPIKAKYFVILYGILELFLGVANFRGDNIAHFAHLGGMLFAYLLIRYWKKRRNNDYYDTGRGFGRW